jgi:hypothetical protein
MKKFFSYEELETTYPHVELKDLYKRGYYVTDGLRLEIYRYFPPEEPEKCFFCGGEGWKVIGTCEEGGENPFVYYHIVVCDKCEKEEGIGTIRTGAYKVKVRLPQRESVEVSTPRHVIVHPHVAALECYWYKLPEDPFVKYEIPLLWECELVFVGIVLNRKFFIMEKI